MPLITVVIPVYNSENTIMETIRSVQLQTIQDFQIIVVDDCSQDKSSEVIQRIMSEDSRIRYIRTQKNMGVASARNLGCSHVSSEYIAFLDSDDLWLPKKLERQVCYMDRDGIDICYTSYFFIKQDGTPDGKRYEVPLYIDYKGLLKENVIGCSTVLLRTELLEKHHFMPDFSHEDYALWLELLKVGYKACGVRDNLVAYRMGGRSSQKWKAAQNRWHIYREKEKMSLPLSLYYSSFYIFNAINKYF